MELANVDIAMISLTVLAIAVTYFGVFGLHDDDDNNK